jgi:hypothetical protein
VVVAKELENAKKQLEIYDKLIKKADEKLNGE